MKLKLTKADGTTEEIEVEAYEAIGEEPVTESEFATDFVALSEKALNRSNQAQVKIIQPGWGSSAYYSESVLKRDGPRVFHKGLKSYWNHPTLSERTERPERDLRDLAGELTSDAQYLENGPEGAGLYADMKVFKQYAPTVKDLAPHIGVSIRANGKGKAGVMEGRRGPVLEAITSADSVDFVTAPGAGGKVVQLFESARPGSEEHQEEDEMDEAKVAEMIEAATKPLQESLTTTAATLKDTQTENARLREALVLREARDYIAAELAKSPLPAITRARLAESLATECPVKEGALDKDALTETVKAAVESETQYLTKVTGSPIRGMGPSSAPEFNAEESNKKLESAFAAMGLSESAAKIAAVGRV